jgi:hypothetical protein
MRMDVFVTDRLLTSSHGVERKILDASGRKRIKIQIIAKAKEIPEFHEEVSVPE